MAIIDRRVRAQDPGQPLDRRIRWDPVLFLVIVSCCLVCTAYSRAFTSFVMPHFYDDGFPLRERIASPVFGDSQTYGQYAEDLIRYRAFDSPEGQPVVKHMPGVPIILALLSTMTGSVDAFRLVQILAFFMSFYFFAVTLKGQTPRIVLAGSAAALALHPMMAKHFTGIMTDVLFSAALLLAASTLRDREPAARAFLCTGLLLGVAVYVRESSLIFTLAIGLAYLMQDARLYTKRVALMVAAFLVVLSPWVVRNYVRTHQLLPLTTKSTQLFYYSSFPLTTEMYIPFTNSDYDYDKVRKMHSDAAGSSPSVKEGLRNYASQPRAQAISMLLKTTALLDKPALLGRSLSPDVAIIRRVVDSGLYVFHVAIILVGVVLAFTRANPFPYLPYLLVAQYVQALFFWSEPRYLMPFYGFLIITSLLWYGRWWNHLLCRRRWSAP